MLLWEGLLSGSVWLLENAGRLHGTRTKFSVCGCLTTDRRVRVRRDEERRTLEDEASGDIKECEGRVEGRGLNATIDTIV